MYPKATSCQPRSVRSWRSSTLSGAITFRIISIFPQAILTLPLPRQILSLVNAFAAIEQAASLWKPGAVWQAINPANA